MANNTPKLIIDRHSAHQDPHQLDILKEYVNQADLDLSKCELELISSEGKAISIKQIRELIKKSSYASYSSQMPQLAVIWQADKMSIPAQNALLKLLEEPPKNFFLVLISAFPANILPTIDSRCQTVYSTDTDQTTSQDSEISQLDELLGGKLNFAQSIELAGEYSDQQQAILLTTSIIQKIKQSPSYPNPSAIKNIQLAGKTLTMIQTNVNAKLALENLLFNFVKK